MGVLRPVLALLLVLALGFGSAPSAVAASTITTTLTGQVIGYLGISNIALFRWSGEGSRRG